MKNALFVFALIGCAGSAMGQTISPAGPSAAGQGGYVNRATYQMDDGNAENSFGLTSGGYLVASNQFNVAGGNNVLTSLEVTWGCDEFVGQNGVVAGSFFDVFIWADTLPGAGPQPGSLLFAGGGNIDPGAIDNNVFQTVALPGVVVPGAGFLIAVGQNHAGGTYPFTVDANGPGLGRSFFSGSTGFDPNTNPGFGGGPALDASAIGFGNLNFMIRANAVPTPGALALLGLGGLIVGRRRR
ncbi:hypothetical protein PHYC_01563 [Phycisphaerales bacterium]|nr:hypothetical protein PHYC_01563 [Phycisphaerales bacterium]